MSTKRTELEEHLDALATGGADLDAIYAELARVGEITAEEYEALPRDGAGRIIIATADELVATSDAEVVSGTRGYFNIRDRAAGDPAAAFTLAEWALRRYRAALAEVAEVDEAAAWRQAQVEAWRAKESQKATRTAEFFEGVLDQYMSDFASEERSVVLPGGKLKLIKQRENIEWDEPGATAWALAQDDVDDLAPRKLSRSAVKARLAKISNEGAVTDDGEAVAFVRMVPPAMRDKFSVELT